jgi:poly [ADP-ribose] polymerase
MVSKSANYCYASNSNSTGLLLLCDVALGQEEEMYDANYDADKVVKRAGKHSTKGCGATCPDPSGSVTLEDGVVVPCGKAMSSGPRRSLLYNEFIVYDVKQVKIKYLVEAEFKFSGRYY